MNLNWFIILGILFSIKSLYDTVSDFIKPSQYISFSPPALGTEEEREVLDSLRSGWITTGPKVKEFEKKVAEYSQSKEAVATFSCTDAMHLALNALGVKEGDEVSVKVLGFDRGKVKLSIKQAVA